MHDEVEPLDLSLSSASTATVKQEENSKNSFSSPVSGGAGGEDVQATVTSTEVPASLNRKSNSIAMNDREGGFLRNEC